MEQTIEDMSMIILPKLKMSELLTKRMSSGQVETTDQLEVDKCPRLMEEPVSYTHLDVYKRQLRINRSLPEFCSTRHLIGVASVPAAACGYVPRVITAPGLASV